ncbi:uncharacterized protein LOC126837957 isoform X2 [Adelges cooleyi]|uniref:uncharacterized protein LOC126837957 isoform X2 n=1 Tax=Adelges cooleyi TaxID=133065 RepID=UPI0021809002|nr:uncharacterized protein LOC126837957 isoform X2 [Adelges cooleyi]
MKYIFFVSGFFSIMGFLKYQKTIIDVVFVTFSTLLVKSDENNIFQGIESRPLQESVKLNSLIPTLIEKKNVNPTEIFRETYDGNCSNCILTLNKAADELLRQVGNEVYINLKDALNEYTDLAFELIKASASEGRALETVDFVNFLSLKNSKGYCATTFLYRTNAYEEPLFNLYLLFSDLQNVFISSVDKPYNNEKLLQFLERNTKKSQRVLEIGNYNSIKRCITKSRQIIDDISSPFCIISQSWFHPKYLKWKNLMYGKNGDPTFDPTVIKYATEKRKQALGVSALPTDWYNSIRSESDVNVLLEFNSQIVEGAILTVADHALRLLNFITMALDDLANSVRNGSIDLPTDKHNKKRIDPTGYKN